MLANLFKVGQAIRLPLHYTGHTAKCSDLKLFTSVQRIAEFDKLRVIAGNTCWSNGREICVSIGPYSKTVTIMTVVRVTRL